MYRLSACIVLSALLVACSSTPVAPAASPSTVQPNSTSRAGTAPLSAVANVTAAPSGSEDAADLQSGGRSVYFDFDDAVVRPEYFSLVERQGRYLREHPALSVTVQGNTDERGSAEYNLALGQRRAQAVRSALMLQGARDSQVEAVSFGEEKPAAPGHDETAWKQNRRADIVRVH